MEVILLWMDYDMAVRNQLLNGEIEAHLLAVAGNAFLPFCAVREGGGFGVETMQTIGMLIDEGIIFSDKLPSNLVRNDVGVNGRRC